MKKIISARHRCKLVAIGTGNYVHIPKFWIEKWLGDGKTFHMVDVIRDGDRIIIEPIWHKKPCSYKNGG